MDPEGLNERKRRKQKKFFGPLIIISVGFFLLLQRLPIELPEWLFSWNIVLIVVGIALAIKTRFHHWIWLVPILIGAGRILAEYFIEKENHNLIFPLGLIVMGCYIIFHLLFYKKDCCQYIENKEKGEFRHEDSNRTEDDEDCYIQIENSFGGTERSFISKNLMGGYIKNTFGGVRINLTQADFEESLELHIENTFGGITLYVPKNWKAVVRLDSHLSGIDDNSYFEIQNTKDTKYLILKGKSIFGGIEIKNF